MYIIVAGGGMVGGLLVQKLLEGKHDVVLIDPSKEVCDKLYAETGVIAIHGNATRIEVLKEAGLGKAEAMIITTPNDADNLACAVLAKSLGVGRVIVRMRDPNYENAYKVAGVNIIVRVTDLMVNQMILEIAQPKVRRITAIGGGRANIFMVLVPDNAEIAGKKIEEVSKSPEFPPDCIFIAVYNQQREVFSIPRGSHVINEGDELFFISTAENIKRVTSYLTAKAESAVV
jgi:trk system potassium uptake protein TrkA